MSKWFIGLMATVSALFTGNIDQPPPAPLNTEIIAFNETYYAPVVADPGNFPRSKTVKTAAAEPQKEASKPAPAPVIPLPTTPPPPPPPSPPDQYLAFPEPITNWLRMDFTLGGDGFEGTREFASIKIDREYWKLEVFSYWAVGITPPKPPAENDYLKLEVYEKGTNKLIYTIGSGKEESFHKYQAFMKPGEYYFKTYTKPVMKYEIQLFVSSKIVQ